MQISFAGLVDETTQSAGTTSGWSECGPRCWSARCRVQAGSGGEVHFYSGWRRRRHEGVAPATARHWILLSVRHLVLTPGGGEAHKLASGLRRQARRAWKEGVASAGLKIGIWRSVRHRDLTPDGDETHKLPRGQPPAPAHTMPAQAVWEAV